MPKQDEIVIRSGTRAAIDAMPVGQRLVTGELAYSTDTFELFVGAGINNPPKELSGYFRKQTVTGYTGGDIRGEPQAGSTNFIDICSKKGVDGFFPPETPRAGQNSICLTTSGMSWAGGSNSMALGPGDDDFTTSANATTSIVIGFGQVQSGANNSIIVGSGPITSIANVVILGAGGCYMRAQAGGVGSGAKRMWCWTVQDRADPFASHSSESFGNCPHDSLPRRAMAFRRNGGDLFIDYNHDGVIRTYNLASLLVT
jgi:hypothetical protein